MSLADFLASLARLRAAKRATASRYSHGFDDAVRGLASAADLDVPALAWSWAGERP